MVSISGSACILVLVQVIVSSYSFQSHLIFRRVTPKRTSLASSNESDVQMQTWNPLRLLVLRLGLTEPTMTSPFNYGKYDGEFTCAYCGHVLFDSSSKYDSGSGWPSFWRTAQEGSLKYKRELDGRLECQCSKCSR